MSTQPTTAPCDLCGDEPSVFSMMNLVEYAQLNIGQACLVPFYVSQLQALTGQEPDLHEPGKSDGEPASPPAEPAGEPAGKPAGEPASEPGPDAGPPAPRARRAGGKR